MSAAIDTWYSLPDLTRLAERRATLAGEIELTKLARLNEVAPAKGGTVKARLRFLHHGPGWVSAEIECAATLTLICQRCLEPLAYDVSAHVELGLVETESVEKLLPQGCEPYVLEEGRVSPAMLVEDELIVSLPLVARHARLDQCGSLARRLESPLIEAASDAPDGARPVSH